ncbi:uncharacterized PE-PGRS family protein PE_PGRS24 [Anastrepha ludens]|uniref:uncharacterized PE-PGRS family protein PE_PGRS24 n=1 Tax=Anastrepha ludens TaxID=28586 RepID=UPI0023B07545|nr:uncharacterized PE-PGRS family protein PE_PGRS24 [Anastrepha ludens]XP_053957031.1 uncharacterized PE-PGRS family protein PE_PGRS24 [Anastrepha ludens]
MSHLQVLIALTTLLCSVFGANEDAHWVWPKRGDSEHRPRPFHNEISARYQGSALRRNARARDREPTTRRPLPGQPQNDEIDDYPDEEVNTNVGTRNYPYPPFGNGQQFGINNYPSFGGIGGPAGGGNGILVGPGGPTGIIGRPQPQYPGAFPANGFIGQPGVGFPAQPGIFGGGNAGGSGYIGPETGLSPGFGGQFGGAGQFASGQYPAGGQYPIGGQFEVNGQYPGAFAAGGTQYPGGQAQGNQFPAAQYPSGGPQYTEGYGFPAYIQYSGGSPFGYATTFNDNENTNRNLEAEGKSAVRVKSSKLTDQVDDKISKGFTKVPN